MIIYFVLKILHIGNIMQNAITYHKQLLPILNNWLFNLNTKIFKSFLPNQLLKNYSLEYFMFSDIFSNEKRNEYILTYYNINLLKLIYPTLTKYQKSKIKKNILNNISLLTADILALLNVFHHFSESESGKFYVLLIGKKFDNKKYINEIYFNYKHFFLYNLYEALNVINNNKIIKI